VVSLQTRKLGTPLEIVSTPDAVEKLRREDKITGLWYRIGCLLFAFEGNKRKQTGIDLLFFESYKDELQSISSQHDDFAEPVRRHINAISRNPSLLRAGVVNDNDKTLFDELTKLGERLYTFVACGVRSSVNTGIERTSILKKLGFLRGYSPQPRGDTLALIGPIAGLSFIAIMIVSVFTGFLTGLFHAKIIAPLGDPWSAAFPVPKGILNIYLWSWTTALFYASAIIGAITLRQLRINRRQWFDINELNRDRPVLHYIVPTLVGTACGCVMLVIIAVVNGPGFHFDLPGVSDLMEAIQLSFPWYPLAVAISVISLWLVDSNMFDERGKWPLFAGAFVVDCSLPLSDFSQATSRFQSRLEPLRSSIVSKRREL
jgi:hypothetical protein